MIKEGEAVGAGFGTIRIVQLSALKITANISEEYTGQISAGDSVQITIPVTNQHFTSAVRAVSMVINPQNRTFPIEINFPAETPGIQPNMLAVLTINNYTNQEAITVPVNIVQKTGTNNFLFLATRKDTSRQSEWQVVRRTVRTGKNYDNYVEIKDGLNPGDYVVMRGFLNLADGQTVIANLNE